MSSNTEAKIKITAVDETREAFKSASEGLTQFKEHGEKLNGMLAALLPALGAAEFTEIIKGSAETADQMNKLSARAGLTVEAFNGLAYAARLSDVDTQTFSKSMEKLNNYMAQAHIKGGQQAAMLQSLGITAKDPEQAMYQLADAMKRIEDPAQRVYVAQQLMGKGGAAMIPALMDGGDALRHLAEEGQKLNPITTEFARQSEEMNDNLERLKVRGEGTATVLAEGIVPAVNDVIKTFMDMSGNGHEVAEVIGKGVGDALRGVAIAGGFVVYSFKDVGSQIAFLAAEADALAHGDIDAMKAISAQRDKDKAEMDANFDSFRDKMLGLTKASDEMGEHGKKAALDLADAAGVGNQQLQNLAARIKQSTHNLQEQADSTSKLTETQKMRSEVDKMVEAGQLDLSGAQRKYVDSLLAEMSAAEQLKLHHDADIAAQKEAQKLIDKAHAQTQLTIEQTQFEQSLIGKSAEEIKKLTNEHNADLNVRKAIAELNANPKFKDHPEEIEKVTAALREESRAELENAEAKRKAQLVTQFQGQDPSAASLARYKKQMDDLKAFHAAGLLEDQDYNRQMYQAELDNQNALMALSQQGKLNEAQMNQMFWYTKLEAASQFMQMEIGAGAQHSRALFNINKAAKLAEAAVTLPSTVMKAFEFGTSMGGPWLGAAFGAVAFAAQSAQMQAIAAAQYGGGSVGAAPSAGGGISTTALPGQTANPNVIAASAPPPATAQAAAPQRVVNINLSGTDIYSASAIRDQLIPALNNAIGDGVTINVGTA